MNKNIIKRILNLIDTLEINKTSIQFPDRTTGKVKITVL